ncbi:MAG: transglycosylase SLT domain-containing protein, partial [Bdellovibrionales bacterium]|nr:transglycosylase SLT domain-containing protein [Bdellovibrionales bacterium]
PYYAKKKNDFNYLMLIGNAAAKIGEFRTAVGAYYRGFELQSRRSSKGKDALFRAAFLSYQFQDYDGAYRKFEQFKELYPSSGLTRDASWHMAWLKYLKGDYDGAIVDLKDIHRQARRHYRRWRKYPLEKIQFWLGMAHLRKKSFNEARDFFENIIKKSPLDYYAQAARSRLLSIPAPNENTIRGLASAELENAPEEENGSPGEMAAADAESEETLMNQDAQEGAEDISANEVPIGDNEAQEVDDDRLFRSVKFQESLDRAMGLIDVGLYMWAKNELYEIEKRTRQKDHRLKLIKAYESIASFNRSSYIAEIYFAKERHRGGLDREEILWKSAYPLAFANEVTHFANQFGIEKEFIWELMRAESRYKQDISSPVGARGLMQLMPHTAMQVSRLLGDSSFNPDTLTQPAVNIRLGTRYLQRLAKKFKGQLPLMAAAYNAGPHRVESWLSTFGHLDMDEFIEHIPFVETRNYVKKVTRNYGVYKALYGKDVTPLAWLPKSIDVPNNIRPVTRETWDQIDL